MAQGNSEEDTSSSSEDDEDAELLTEELEKGFFTVLSQLKKKDPNLYDKSVTYFPKEDSTVTNSSCRPKIPQQLKSRKKWLQGEETDVEALDTGTKEDQFLQDYILNKKFLGTDKNFNINEELKKLSEEEKEMEEQTLFEIKYNYRYENPDYEFLQKYPNTMKKTFEKNLNESTSNVLGINRYNVEENVVKQKRKRVRHKNLNRKQNGMMGIPNKNGELTNEQSIGIKRKSRDLTEIKEKKCKLELKTGHEGKLNHKSKLKPETREGRKPSFHKQESEVNISESKGKNQNFGQDVKEASKNNYTAHKKTLVTEEINKKTFKQGLRKKRKPRSKSNKVGSFVELSIDKGKINMEKTGIENQTKRRKRHKEKLKKDQHNQNFKRFTMENGTFNLKTKDLPVNETKKKKVKRKPRHRSSLKNTSLDVC